MHGLILAGVTGLPDFLHGKAHDGGEPCCQAQEHFIDDSAARTAARAIERVTIKRVFADIEIKGREINRAEIKQRAENFLMVMICLLYTSPSPRD